MMQSDLTVLRTDLQGHLPLLASGKVRDIYEIDETTLLFVTTDRISGKYFHPAGCTILIHCVSLRCGHEQCTTSSIFT